MALATVSGARRLVGVGVARPVFVIRCTCERHANRAVNGLTLMNSISSANNILLSDLRTMFRLYRNERTTICRCYESIAAKANDVLLPVGVLAVRRSPV